MRVFTFIKNAIREIIHFLLICEMVANAEDQPWLEETIC